MKHCNNCDIDVDNTYNLCPYCGSELVANQSTQSSRNASWQSGENAQGNTTGVGHESEMVFEEIDRNHARINGMVVESSTQQFYQSKFTKLIQSFFHGEPYQLSHTTFITVFRVQEHVQRGFAERGRDITVYGNVQNLLASGDDVTVIARIAGNRYIAQSIYNHSIDAQVTSQSSMVPAWLIRVLIIIPLIIIGSLLMGILSSPTIIIDVVVWAISRCWLIILVICGWVWLAKKIKKKK